MPRISKTKIKKFYKGKHIAIIGGLGFIGQNIANFLFNLNSKVTIIDRNIEKGTEKYKRNECIIKKANKIISTDITKNFDVLKEILKSNDIVVNLLGYRYDNIYESLNINCIFHLNFLELCRKIKTDCILVYIGSRLEYGYQKILPVKENVALNPNTIYGIHKLIGEKYYLYFSKKYGIKVICFRLTNPYGPYTNFENAKNVLNYLIFRAFKGNNIIIFGDGEQYKDPIYIEDAVQGILETVLNKKCYGEVFNLGYGKGYKFKDIAYKIMEIINPDIRIIYNKKINPDDPSFIADISKIKKFTGWEPKIDFERGLIITKKYLEKLCK